MAPTIRKATPQDAAAVARVHILSWRQTYTGLVPQSHLDSLNLETRTKNWRSHLETPGSFDVFLAAPDDGEVYGIAAAGKRRSGGQASVEGSSSKGDGTAEYDGEVYLIYVLNEAKGRGIGRLLMRAVAESMRGEGLSSAMLWVLEDNPSRGFYERLGAEEFAKKTAAVGGADLVEVAYGWKDLQGL